MQALTSSDQPELVFGLVGPLGVDMNAVQDALEGALRQVRYVPHVIHLTKEVATAFPHLGNGGEAKSYSEKISSINKLRTESGSNDFLSKFAILNIVRTRFRINKASGKVAEDDLHSLPATGHAFIIRQLKREEEVDFLRKIYGRRFIQVSVTLSEAQQHQAVTQIVAKQFSNFDYDARALEAKNLIDTDKNELGEKFGQRLSNTFHLGDVFVNGDNDDLMRSDTQRFINALFGMNSISPTIDEFGSYLAKTASLRSVDMSRQVGSAIISPEGDIITIGCNEVPRPGGGNYWCSDSKPQRDIDRKVEANKLETSRIIHDFVSAIEAHGSLNTTADKLLRDPSFQNILKETLVSDITEFGRMTHAEMAALSDAARLGRSVKGATIYVTTYPCHNCAKHLIAAGVERIVYIEPYPKSRAIILHDDALTHEEGETGKVVLSHFHGISPRRYRDIFEKAKRKDSFNNAKMWYETTPKPLVGGRFSTHVLFESAVLDEFKKTVLKIGTSTDTSSE